MTYRFTYYAFFSSDLPKQKRFYEIEADSYQEAVTAFSYFIRHSAYVVVDFAPNYVVVSPSGDKSFRKFKERGIFVNFVS